MGTGVCPDVWDMTETGHTAGDLGQQLEFGVQAGCQAGLHLAGQELQASEQDVNLLCTCFCTGTDAQGGLQGVKTRIQAGAGNRWCQLSKVLPGLHPVHSICIMVP